MSKKKVESQRLEVAMPVEIEPLLSVLARANFNDGNLNASFRAFGYSGIWKGQAVRKIPVWLYRKCIESGGRFDILNG